VFWSTRRAPSQLHYPPEADAAGISGGFQFWGKSSSS
jgi:hypothetical protein